eukprot:PhM_4_TR10403/c0_g1_i1/m.21585
MSSPQRPALVVMGYHPSTKQMIDDLAPSIFSRVTYVANVEEYKSLESDQSDSFVALIGSTTATEILKHISETTPERLLWVHSIRTGIDPYELHKIAHVFKAPMSNARGVFASLLAEHVALACLYFSRKVPLLQRNRKEKVWDRFPNPPLRGATMGIVGYGNIGRAVANVMIPFGMNVIGLRRSEVSVDSGGNKDDLGVTQLSGADGFKHIISHSDFVVAILPDVPDTHDVFTADVFHQMKRSAVFINIGRGVCVVEDDLVRALDDGVIAGAALDVFRTEPLPSDSPLWGVPDDKLLLTPHSADISATSFRDAVEQFVEHAKRFVADGMLPQYLVDIVKGY